MGGCNSLCGSSVEEPPKGCSSSRHPYTGLTWASSLGAFWNMLICKLVFAVKQALIILTCSHYVSQTTVVGNVALNKEADLCLESCSQPAAHPWSVSTEPGLCVDTQVGRATSASVGESLPVEIRDNS